MSHDSCNFFFPSLLVSSALALALRWISAVAFFAGAGLGLPYYEELNKKKNEKKNIQLIDHDASVKNAASFRFYCHVLMK